MGINDDLIEDYRNYITNTILSNETIVKLLSNDRLTLDEADELLYGDDPHVQPHEFIPGTITETGSYIMYDMEENAVYSRGSTVSTYTEVTLYFWVITHKNQVKYKGRLSNDVLVRELKYSFGEKNGLGIAKNHFVYNRIYNVGNNNYTGRLVKFVITDWSDRVRLKD